MVFLSCGCIGGSPCKLSVQFAHSIFLILQGDRDSESICFALLALLCMSVNFLFPPLKPRCMFSMTFFLFNKYKKRNNLRARSFRSLECEMDNLSPAEPCPVMHRISLLFQQRATGTITPLDLGLHLLISCATSACAVHERKLTGFRHQITLPMVGNDRSTALIQAGVVRRWMGRRRGTHSAPAKLCAAARRAPDQTTSRLPRATP